jgi:hypothetical protein
VVVVVVVVVVVQAYSTVGAPRGASGWVLLGCTSFHKIPVSIDTLCFSVFTVFFQKVLQVVVPFVFVSTLRDVHKEQRRALPAQGVLASLLPSPRHILTPLQESPASVHSFTQSCIPFVPAAVVSVITGVVSAQVCDTAAGALYTPALIIFVHVPDRQASP